MIQRLLALLNRRKPKLDMQNQEVIFIHHKPAHGNIGDYLCSPMHYFHFKTDRPAIAIVGGGVFKDHGRKLVTQQGLSLKDSVLWGTGRSHKGNFDGIEKVEKLPHLMWGIRDIDGVKDTNHFLPCVSCLHPMLDRKIEGTSICLFLNIDPEITPTKIIERLHLIASARKWNILFNNCQAEDIEKMLTENSKIITNSFHGAYWGILSGHHVRLLGYSSKFNSLLISMGLSSQSLIRFEKENYSEMCALIEESNDMDFIYLPNHRAKLEEFRKINIKFASNLKHFGIFTSAIKNNSIEDA